MTLLVAAFMLAQQPPVVRPPEPASSRMSDADYCTAARQIAGAASGPAPRMIDAVTRMDGISLSCRRKRVATDHRIVVSPSGMEQGWRARRQEQWTRFICDNEALRALASRGWRFSRTMTFESGERVTQDALCPAGGEAGESMLALQVATAFNLICAGTVQEVPDELLAPIIERGPFRLVYRIDLELGRYCMGACVSTQAFQSVTQREIRFWSAGYRAALPRGLTSVDRETGRYRDVKLTETQSIHRNGSCERAPFTGFPARR